MKYLVNFIYFLLLIAISPVLLYRRFTQGRYKIGWSQRLGSIQRRYPEKKCIWIHAVSLGEVNAAISTTTDTGHQRATALFAAKHNIFFFPFDISFVMEKAFNNIKPCLCILMELEVWYNYTCIANRRGIPIVVVNGRLSTKSFGRYRKIRPLITPMFEKLPLVLAQTEDYARRFIHLGCPDDRVQVTGSLKYDTAQVINKVEGTDKLARKINLNPGPFWVAGGTGPEEENIILEVFTALKQDKATRDLQLAIVPRKPERFDDVARLIVATGYTCVRYSRYKNTDAKAEPSDNAVILGDTMGDLRKFYCLADIIFVGRSLVPMGGSDMMEAAAVGKCTMFGPHAFNFQQTVEALLAGGGAILVQDKNELIEAMKKCLTNDAVRTSIASAGQNIIKANQGATARTMDAIKSMLNQ